MKKLWRKALLWFTRTKIYKWLIIKVIPFIRFTTYYASLRGDAYHEGYALLEPGDIILTKDKKKLTTLLIGGEWTHAALCVDKVGSWSFLGFEVAEMTHNNFTRSWFFDVVKEADRVAILRCKDFDPDYILDAIEKCLTFDKAEYDVEFNLGVEALYCSELVYQADFERRLKVSLEDIAGLGTPYISPTGLWRAKNCEVVFDSGVKGE